MSNESTLAASNSVRIFQLDRFQLSQPVAVSEKHLIRDEAGKPLLVVKCPSRLGRLVAAVLLAFLALMLFLFVGIVGLAGLKIFDLLPIVMADRQTVLGVLNRRTTEKEGNRLDLQKDADHYLDRRVALALAVLLNQK